MALEKLRIRKIDENLSFIEDDNLGILRYYHNELSEIDFADNKKYHLLDIDKSGKLSALNSKEWLTIRSANKTQFIVINNETGRILFSTKEFLVYNAKFDLSSSKCIIEYYGGIASIDLDNSQVSFKKRTELTIYNATLLETNEIILPIENRKSISIFDFQSEAISIEEINTSSTTTWVKQISNTNQFLISDKRNKLYRFDRNDLSKPIWVIDFNKFSDDGRIWCFEPFINGDYGCIHGFMPKPDQTATEGGKLWVFDTSNGELIKDINYSVLNQAIVDVDGESSIVLQDLTSFNLITETHKETNIKEKLKLVTGAKPNRLT